MKYAKTKVAAAIALTISTAYAEAAIVGPTNMVVTGGSYGLGAFTGGLSYPIGSGVFPGSFDSTNDITDQYNLPGWDTTVPQASGVLAPGAIFSFAFGTGATDQVNAFFAPSAVGAAGGGPVPVFMGSLVNGNVSSIDMRSFFVNRDGSTWNQGDTTFFNPSGLVSNLTMSNCTASGCNWTMSWNSKIAGGPWDGNTGTWALSGTIAAVPEASTYGMMLAGLCLVGFMARCRKQTGKRLAPVNLTHTLTAALW